jgi:hypothetical protein
MCFARIEPVDPAVVLLATSLIYAGAKYIGKG